MCISIYLERVYPEHTEERSRGPLNPYCLPSSGTKVSVQSHAELTTLTTILSDLLLVWTQSIFLSFQIKMISKAGSLCEVYEKLLSESYFL